jgi:hypothetical protein
VIIRRATVHRFLALLVALIVSACGAQTVVSPSGPINVSPTPDTPSFTASAGASGDALFAAVLADAIARAGQPVGDGDVDLGREQLLTAMEVGTSLGADADRILGLVAVTEAAAHEKQPIPPALGPTSSVGRHDTFVDAVAIVAAFRGFPSPFIEFVLGMAGTLENIGRAGANTLHEDLGTASDTESGGGLTNTTQMHTIVDVVIAGSDVKLTIDRDVQNTVTDIASGSTVFTETKVHKIMGEINVCPSAAGLVPAFMSVSLTEEASTFAGAGGRVGSHATGSSTTTSQFEGTVDDQATLGRVSQTFSKDEKFKRTASADGGPEATKEGAFSFGATGIDDGVPVARDYSIMFGDLSGATTTGSVSGDVTPQMTASIAGDAGSHYATMEASYVEAQRLWRNYRCVIVTAPEYIPASAFEFNARPTHTEEVDKGSTTQFEVGIGHRFGQSVSARITAELSRGKDTLSPDLIEKPPGKLTYVAPDEDGQDATVTLATTSRQGIGNLILTFHTGGKRLKVSINGKMTTSGFGVSYVTTLHTSDLAMVRLPGPGVPSRDGSTYDLPYAGSGPATAEILIGIADCPKPFTQKGTFKLLAKHVVNEEQGLDLGWDITWDPLTTFTSIGGACMGLTLESFTGAGGAGPIAGFMTVLGPVRIKAGGETLRVQLTKALGGSKNVIDATITAEIVSESGR